jgi:hypothetical protein
MKKIKFRDLKELCKFRLLRGACKIGFSMETGYYIGCGKKKACPLLRDRF